jgi:predicted metal-dependent peptidase
MDAVMPGMQTEPMIDIAVFLMHQGQLAQQCSRTSWARVGGIMEQFPAYRIHVVTFDTDAYNPRQYDSENLDDIGDYEVQGGGGTDFDCNLPLLERQRN